MANRAPETENFEYLVEDEQYVEGLESHAFVKLISSTAGDDHIP